MDSASFVCPVCRQHHDELPHISSDFPEPYFAVPEDELDARVAWTPDTCVIDDEQFLVRAILELQLDDHPDPLGFNLWISLAREEFLTYVEHFESADIGPFRVAIATELAGYPRSTVGLEATVYFRGGGQRPRLDLDQTDHPLSLDQRTGITLSMACQLIHYFD
jgi:hypothetical protein